MTACVVGAVDPCAVQNGCFMSGNWNKVNGAINEALSGVSLAEMFNPEEMFVLPEPDPALDADSKMQKAWQE